MTKKELRKKVLEVEARDIAHAVADDDGSAIIRIEEDVNELFMKNVKKCLLGRYGITSAEVEGTPCIVFFPVSFDEKRRKRIMKNAKKFYELENNEA